MDLLTLVFRTAFVENLALNYLLGMCTYIAVSQRVVTAVGLSIAMTVVLTITVPLNYLIFEYLLAAGGLDWLGLGYFDLSFLRFVAFIGVIAAFVQILELVLETYAPRLQHALGIYLPLLTVNCAILGASLFMVQRAYGLAESIAFGFGSGAGWGLAIVLFATIREHIDEQFAPAGLRGLGLAFIVTGLLALGFSGLRGVEF
jgi:Na+-transporting NADH:ubiquinone oxidoreductase subunit E